MGKLVYSSIASVDGYVADENGNFAWAAPDAEVHAAVNDLERRVGTYLYGRRMYEMMAAWETLAADDPVTRDFGEIWRAADKIVYSTTLDAAVTPRTRIERTFDADAVRTLKAATARDISVGGPGLATSALAARLVDELHLFVVPVVVGGGTRWLPDAVHVQLELADERRFAGGVVHLHYMIA
jgi:dihydrofolate reductase